MASRRDITVTTLHGLDGHAVYRLVQERRAATSTFGRAFVITFSEASELLRHVRHPTALRLSHMLPHMLSASDWRRLDQRKLAEDLRVSQPSISQGLTVLIQAGVLEREGRGPGVRYRISPRVHWKGTVGQYHQQQGQEGRNYEAEAAGYRLTVQLHLPLDETRRGRRKKGD